MKRVFWGLLILAGLSLGLMSLMLEGQARVPGRDGAGLSERVHQAREALRRNDPRGQPAGPRQLRLAESELEWLLDLGLSRWRPGASDVHLRTGSADVTLSIELPLPARWRWLNIQTSWTQAPAQALWPALDRARIGRLPLPAPLSGWLLHHAARRALGEADLRLLRGMLRELRFEPRVVDLRYEWRSEDARQLVSRVWPEEEQARLREYQTLIGTLAARLAPGQAAPLAPWLEALLKRAAERSGGREATAAAENRAVLLTLGVYASGNTWARFLPTARDWPAPRPHVLLLDGREDFTLHLLISAAIAIEGGGPVTDAIGLYKEIADTRGGSGFSFNDLAADAAGKRLGLLSQQHPLRLQRLAAAGTRESDFMPSVADLPEFLSTEQLERRFGGPTGDGTQAMVARIERRVDALPWFR